MSDAVLIACITNATTIAAIVISRVLSHFEHRGTSAKIDEIHVAMNGKEKVEE